MRRRVCIVGLGLLAWTGSAAAQSSKLGKEQVAIGAKAKTPHKNKLCCGYPLSEELGFKLTFYWQARQGKHLDHYDSKSFFRWRYQDLYTPEGDYLGTFHERFVAELKMEGSGWLHDGTVINWAGRCRYGAGICFRIMDRKRYPYGRGAGPRPLVPFKSIAVDRRLVPLGETLYVPEFDGMVLPDGSIHDGCIRADDVGGAIRKRLVDFFVVELPNFRKISDALWGLRRFTPHIEDPRCDYLRREPLY